MMIGECGNVLATGSRISKVYMLHQIICIPQSIKLSHIVYEFIPKGRG